MARRGAALLALELALAVSVPAQAQPADDLQRDDALVQTIGWRLSHANAAFCTRAAPATGLLLGDVQTFADPAAARAAYGLSGDIAVAAVAAGSPAEAAGLAANAVVAAVEGTPVGPPPARGNWDRVWALQARLEQAAAQRGEVALTLADGRAVTVPAAPSCGVRFILDDAKDNAGATRSQVRIGRRALDQLGRDEAMIAAVLAHELAHAALDHETLLGPGQRPTAAVRRTEREADRLSVWIMANAGYSPEAALRMIRLITPRGLLVIPGASHGKASTRAREMAEEIAVMRTQPDTNWALRFRREP
ncbi:M48 family metalloprotease [Novosphingobium sp.]|uniref:M48 family metalloprotease n=1 Tax=Novosphingobium sp. TaxID=1874826 RepID=UPI00260FB160|nr:M48 family metalloprotease [Novosphingobium sp.]